MHEVDILAISGPTATVPTATVMYYSQNTQRALVSNENIDDTIKPPLKAAACGDRPYFRNRYWPILISPSLH